MTKYRGLVGCVEKAREILESLKDEEYSLIEVATIVNIMDKEVQGTLTMHELIGPEEVEE